VQFEQSVLLELLERNQAINLLSLDKYFVVGADLFVDEKYGG
jgi:hypothetical protein